MVNEYTRYRIPKEKHAAFLSDYASYIPCIEEMRHYAPTDLDWTRE